MWAYALETASADVSSATVAQGMTLWEIVMAGGWSMVVIGALSVWALGLVLWQIKRLRRSVFIGGDWPVKLVSSIEAGDWEAAELEVRRQRELPLGRLCQVLLENKQLPLPKLEQILADEASRVESQYRLSLHWLADIGTIAPMLGLLGTVLGMIQAFNVIAFDVQMVKPIMLAHAVAKALVTTAAGLIVAIPAMFFFFVFRNRLLRLLTEMEEEINRILRALASRQGGK